MRILVIGGSGLVGSHVLAAARQAGHEVVGTFHQQAQSGLVPLACGDAAQFETLLDRHQPEAVVHAAGWTWVDGCEDDPARAMRENAEEPIALARRCTAAGVRFAYFSTSYIFDGTRGPYTEEDEPGPVNVYAQSKLAGERGVLEATSGRALVPRVICVYGAEARRKNFAWQVLGAMRDGRVLTLPVDQRGNPSYAGDLGRWLVGLLERGATGVWHLAGPDPECTRPAWAERLVESFRACGVQPHPSFSLRGVTTVELKQKALRPLHAGMWTRKLGAADPAVSFQQSIEQTLAGKLSA